MKRVIELEWSDFSIEDEDYARSYLEPNMDDVNRELESLSETGTVDLEDNLGLLIRYKPTSDVIFVVGDCSFKISAKRICKKDAAQRFGWFFMGDLRSLVSAKWDETSKCETGVPKTIDSLIRSLESLKQTCENLNGNLANIRWHSIPEREFLAYIQFLDEQTWIEHGKLHLFWVDRKALAYRAETLDAVSPGQIFSISDSGISAASLTSDYQCQGDENPKVFMETA